MKKHNILLILIPFLVFACENKQQFLENAKLQIEKDSLNNALQYIQSAKNCGDYAIEEEAKKMEDSLLDIIHVRDYKLMRKNREDAIIYDFRFGMKKREVDEHIKSLLDTKKIKPKKSFTLSVGYGKNVQKIPTNGYIVEFPLKRHGVLDSYECVGVLSEYYFLNDLDKIEIIFVNHPFSENNVLGDLKLLFNQKYGENRTDFNKFYSEEESKHIKYFWQFSNRSIKITAIAGHIAIVYEDLIAKKDKSSLEEDLQKVKEKESRKRLNELQGDI